MKFKGELRVQLKSDVLDVQGKAVEQVAHRMGHTFVKNMRVGKLIELDIEAETAEQAETRLTEIAEKILVNTVIEDYSLNIQSEKE